MNPGYSALPQSPHVINRTHAIGLIGKALPGTGLAFQRFTQAHDAITAFDIFRKLQQ